MSAFNPTHLSFEESFIPLHDPIEDAVDPILISSDEESNSFSTPSQLKAIIISSDEDDDDDTELESVIGGNGLVSIIPYCTPGSDQQNAIIISSSEVGSTFFLSNGRKRRKLNGSVSTIYNYSSDEDLSF